MSWRDAPKKSLIRFMAFSFIVVILSQNQSCTPFCMKQYPQVRVIMYNPLMSTTATGAQQLDSSKYVHPRGFSISSVFTCPVCSKIVQAHRVNIRNGMQTCSQCKTLFKVGIVLYVLPNMPGRTQYLAPDESMPPAERTALGLRRRSRQRRTEYLAELSLADPMPQIAFNRFVRGEPINRVVVVPPPEAPESEPEPRT